MTWLKKLTDLLLILTLEDPGDCTVVRGGPYGALRNWSREAVANTASATGLKTIERHVATGLPESSNEELQGIEVQHVMQGKV